MGKIEIHATYWLANGEWALITFTVVYVNAATYSVWTAIRQL